MATPKNFWIPPASGYTTASAGLTDAQLDAIEVRNGFPLPMAYRSLMHQQNGGTLRYSLFDEWSIEDFCGLFEQEQELVTFDDYVALTCIEDDILALNNQFDYCDLKRLIVFAINGHHVACFDYGWKSEAAIVDPQVVLLGDDGEDILHFKILKTVENFDRFLSEIILPEEPAETTYIGIESSLDFDSLCACLEEDWQTKFEPKHDDFYGWFNFETWYCGTVPLALDDQTLQAYADETNTTIQEVLDWVNDAGRTRSIAAILSPNRHRSGTYLYPDNPELTLVLEICKPWFPSERAVAQLCDRLLVLELISAIKMLP
jgi:SMI1 / KNR4 family (SUKH-1)